MGVSAGVFTRLTAMPAMTAISCPLAANDTDGTLEEILAAGDDDDDSEETLAADDDNDDSEDLFATADRLNASVRSYVKLLRNFVAVSLR